MILRNFIVGNRWLILLLIFVSISGADLKFNPDKAHFSVHYNQEHSQYRVNGIFLMPKESLTLEVRKIAGDSFSLAMGNCLFIQTGGAQWNWQAPDTAGIFSVIVYCRTRLDSIVFNIIVMEPATKIKNGYLDDYHIGEYPIVPFQALPFYKRPFGFIKVDPLNKNLPVSPHFQLGQFICKQPSGPVAYMVLKERLILKLEAILEEANKQGYRCQTLHIMSGYRTPFYNSQIENVKLSAHQWGAAADIFIDESPSDGEMDDLNGDGKINGKDSRILFELVDRMSLDEVFMPFLGGLGIYIRSKSHGPFIHVDTRGFRALW